MTEIIKDRCDVRDVQPETGEGVVLRGELTIPRGAKATVVFAHGGGSNRHSPRNRVVASKLQAAGYATALIDLVPRGAVDPPLELLAGHLMTATRGIEQCKEPEELPIVYFGASTGAAVALMAAAYNASEVTAHDSTTAPSRAGGIAAVIARAGASAKALDLPLDVIVARKLGAPGQEELAMGAVTADGTQSLNDDLLHLLRANDDYLARVSAEQSAKHAEGNTSFELASPA